MASITTGQFGREPTDGATEPAYQVCDAQTDTSRWSPKVAAFYSYWKNLGRPGELPARSDMDPLHIPALLPSLWLFDVHRDPIRFRTRLMGTRLVDILGVDVTGRWVDDAHQNSPQLGATLHRFERAVREGIATYSFARVALFVGKEHLRIENVTVPLARDGKTVDMLAGLSWITSLSGGRV